ncbi:MAG: S1 family peptidase [Nitrosotalea sp.]
MPQHSKDVTFLNIEKRVNGFSGAYVDESGILNVYTTDPTIKSIDKSTLADYVEPYHLAKGIIVKQSNHSWHKWMELQNIVTKLFDNKDLGITTMNVDDKNQVFRIGFEKLDNSKINTVNKFLADHNIPSDMVKLVETGKFALVNTDIKVQPITAGAEIGVVGAPSSWGPQPSCTTGFIVKLSGGTIRGLTAGHCQKNGPTENDGLQTYTQPWGGRTIGNTIAGTNKQSHSDTVLFSTSETGGFGWIYRYGMSQVAITGKGLSQFVGDSVCTSGTGSGTTRCGSVTQVGITAPGGMQGQNEASFQVVPGDSGSPVWSNPGSSIIAYGTAFAHDTTGTYYSPVGGIDFDQGILQYN